MKSYILKNTGSGKIAANLAAICAMGKLGQPLVENGLNQANFSLFIANLAVDRINAGKSAEQLAQIFDMVSATNASAARQALAGCTIEIDGEKPTSVEIYWQKAGGAKAAPSTSALFD